MIDADHPNTEAGLQLFQTWSNGAHPIISKTRNHARIVEEYENYLKAVDVYRDIVGKLKIHSVKLFVQIERQAANNWLLCCFFMQDSSKVTLRLGNLEDYLKRMCTRIT